MPHYDLVCFRSNICGVAEEDELKHNFHILFLLIDLFMWFLKTNLYGWMHKCHRRFASSALDRRYVMGNDFCCKMFVKNYTYCNS